MKHKTRILLVLMLIMPTGVGNANDNALVSVEQAIRIVDEPKTNYLPWNELQTWLRCGWLLGKERYEYKDHHADAWLKCMRDEKRSMYARLCAAYFLLDQDKEARQFIVSQLKSENLRYRYNAAAIVAFHVERNQEKRWGTRVLIGLLTDGSIDRSEVKEWPGGEYPEGDRLDIQLTPVDQVCYVLGSIKEKEAVPALISVLKRCPQTSGNAAIVALGEIRDKRATPVLIDMLKNGTGEDDVILEALSQIGDKRAIEPIEKYLEEDHPEDSKTIARLSLIHIKSPDPIKDFFALFEKVTNESERLPILFALLRYPDDRQRIVDEFGSIARTSDSAFLRLAAIRSLGNIGNRQALLALASLLDLTLPKNLKTTEWRWQLTPDFEKYFPKTIQKYLKERTKQDFGSDSKKWTKWIEENVKPKGTVDKK